MNCQEKNEQIWRSPMTKAPTRTEKSKKERDNTKHATKNFEYTPISDRVMTVSWSKSSHPTEVVKRIYEPSFGEDHKTKSFKSLGDRSATLMLISLSKKFYKKEAFAK